MGRQVPERWDFFVSATQSDQGWAEWIAWQLEDVGYRVLVQAWDMVAGSNWTATMQDGMRYATRTVAVLSQAYLESVYGRGEWQAAVQADPQGAHRKLVPVRVEDCDRPGLLVQVVSFNLFGVDAATARARLVGKIGEAVAGRAKPPAEPFFPGPRSAPVPPRTRPSATGPEFPGLKGGLPGGAVLPQGQPPGARRFRALLVGVPVYDDRVLRDLPAVAGDVAELAATLEGVGYHVDVQDHARLGASSIKAAVHAFVSGASDDDVLLVWLAGHGVHHGGRDFLVPRDAVVGYQPFWDLCVPLRWDEAVGRSPAREVFFFVDADCGSYDPETRRQVTEDGWGTGEVLTVAGGRVGYVFVRPEDGAPGAGQVGDDSRGLLGRAFRAVLGGGSPPLTAGGFQRALQVHVDRFAGAGCFMPRTVGVTFRGDADPLTLLPSSRARFRAPTAGGHPWLAAAGQHVAWHLSAGGPGAAHLQEAASMLIARLAEERETAARSLVVDPWVDGEFALRMTERVGFLLTRVDSDELGLSPAEAALLVVVPFLHEAFWARQAAAAGDERIYDVGSGSGDRAAFWHFARSFPRLLRRAERATEAGNSAASYGIGWWLLHRWLAARPESFRPGLLTTSLADLAASPVAGYVFRAELVVELLRVLRGPPTFLSRADRRSVLDESGPVGAATRLEQPLRGRMVGYLLAVGHRMALEPVALPEVLVEHLGVADPVDLADLRATLGSAEWRHHGQATRVLAARCAHPAVEVALKRHVATLDALLGEVHRAAAVLPPLAGLPAHATAVGVEAAEVHGGRAYDSAGVRFRMAEDRVQELLMGKQLYSTRGLAVRELYQNALDACRYRQAREEYLGRAEGQPCDWSGRIDFRQGVDESGELYIECRDNGVGMGMRELTDVFAEAGTRSIDMPDVVEEMAAWQKMEPPVEFFPNSRFGIGVLSYFMLADEITIDTCRLSRQGTPEDRLRVTIAGPGNLFRVQNYGPGRTAGTTVRLHLSGRSRQAPVSCVDMLTRILWVAEFETHAVDGAFSRSWQPGRLSEYAPIGTHDPIENEYRSTRRIHDTDVAGVWWCDGAGALLADGLWIGSQVFGAVVNLTGRIRPELSVDRNKIVRHSTPDAVDNLLTSAVPALGEVRLFDVTFDWLCNLTESFPVVADAILDYLAGARSLTWLGSQGERVAAEKVGCFPLDREVLDTTRNAQPTTAQPYASIPDFVVFWRIRCWARTNQRPTTAEKPSAVAGRPSDRVLLSKIGAGRLWTSLDSVPLVRVLFLAGLLRRTPRELATRLRNVGMVVPSLGKVAADEVTAADLVLISSGMDGEEPLSDDWIAPGHVLAAARRTGRPIGEVAGRLAALGLNVPGVGTTDIPTATVDLVLLSENLDGKTPWLEERLVPRGHVLAAALQTRLSTAEIRARLSNLDLAVAESALRRDSVIGTSDVPFLGRNLDGGDWLGTAPVALGHVLAAAARTGEPPQSVARRLRDLGFVVADVPAADVQPDDVDIVSEHHSGRPPWIGCEPIYRPEIVEKARAVGAVPRRVAERLGKFGFVVADLGPAEDTEPDDAQSDKLTRSKFDDGNRISLVSILNAVSRTGRSVNDVKDGFQNLGYAVPDTSDFEFTTDDRILLSDNLTGDGLTVGSRIVEFDTETRAGVGVAHVFAASLRLRRPPGELAARIRFVGLPVADPGGAEASDLTGTDVVLISKELHPLGPWLDDSPVPLVHVLTAALETGLPTSEITARLRNFGVQVVDHRDVELDPDDHDVLTTVLDRPEPRPDGCHDVGLAAVLATAYRTRRVPKDVADRLTDVGLAVAWSQASSAADSADDVVLLSVDVDGRGPWLPDTEVPYVHLLAAAGRLGRPPADVAARFDAMGFESRKPGTGTSPMPERVDAIDLVLLSRNLDGSGPWLGEDPVPAAHLLLAATVLRCSTSEARGRLTALGLSVTDADEADLTPLDRSLLAVIFDGGSRGNWPFRGNRTWSVGPGPVSVAQVLAAAEFTGCPVQDVSGRLADLGLATPTTTLCTGPVDQKDMVLVSRKLNGRGPWRGDGPVPLAHVIAAAGYLRWLPARIVNRLAELGLDAPTLTDTASTAYVDGVDIALVSQSREQDAAPLEDDQISRAHLLANSYHFGRPVHRVAERIAELGFTIPPSTGLQT